jgi:hypothetical protein
LSKLIVTLTSFPARIKTVPIVINALFRQKLKPDMIVLYLGYDKFPNKEKDLPQELVEQTNHGLTIHWVKDIGCFTTLIPALNEFPDDIIINIDDDIYYDNKLLLELYNSYKKNPTAIHTNTAHRIIFDLNGNLLPYLDWYPPTNFTKKNPCFYLLRLLVNIKRSIQSFFHTINLNNISSIDHPEELPSYQNFIISTLGTLYPPHCMHEDVYNVDLAMKICPTNDDIWFWTQAVRNKTKIQITKSKRNRFKYIEGTQSVGLFNSNTKPLKTNDNNNISPNDIQIQKVIDYYPDLLENIKTEPLSIIDYTSKTFFLFNFIPLLHIFHYNTSNIIIALFNIFPLFIIKKNAHGYKIYLFGFLPILKKRINGYFWSVLTRNE